MEKKLVNCPDCLASKRPLKGGPIQGMYVGFIVGLDRRYLQGLCRRVGLKLLVFGLWDI